VFVNEKKTGTCCGIDLGTTNSCIAVLEQGQAQVLELEGQSTIPSVIAWKDGQWLVGQAARNHFVVSPKDAVVSIKRKMDDPGYRLELGDETLTPIDISAKILAALVNNAQKKFDVTIEKAVITVPAWFQEQQRQATLEAGRRAGLEVLQIINEPTAAAIAHERISLDDDAHEHWLVYDLGGGTFDVSLLNVSAASYEVLASEGNTYLGGDDFDHCLVEHFVAHLRSEHHVDASNDILAMARLQVLAEDVKIQLSDSTEVSLHEPLAVDGQSIQLQLTLTRAMFEEMIGNLIESTLEKVAQALTDVNFEPKDVDRLLLVGGSTRIPLVVEKLKQRFGIDAENWLDADLSVAVGACIRAAICDGQIFDRSVVDICPHSLGIAAFGDEDLKTADSPESKLSGAGHPLTFAPLIRRNSRLPAHFVRTFFKLSDDQEGAWVAVYQGEYSNTRHNNLIGEFYVAFSQSHTDKLDVHFSYDLNGTIKIMVTEGLGGTQREYTMDLTRSAKDNSELQLVEKSQDILGGQDGVDELDASVMTNFLVEKVSQKLAEDTQPEPQIVELLERYQKLLVKDEEGVDDELDELEDKLYDWIENV
jgi:molecular chaperone DnaK